MKTKKIDNACINLCIKEKELQDLSLVTLWFFVGLQGFEPWAR